MATFKVSISGKGLRQQFIEAKLKEWFGEKDGVSFSVSKETKIESRADRLGVAESQVEDAKGIVEELRDELQSWHDNLPENLQQGQKASEIEEAVSALEDIQNNLESSDFSGVSFPSMF